MSKKPWKRLSINISQEEWESLLILASVKKMSVSHFMRYLIELHLKDNEQLRTVLEQAKGFLRREFPAQ